ncbi:MAG: alpha/beta hydrolase [Verrucomicrobia bacterium]|nr:alpha/beta hydrolase [Verrucomicrobiota bacterium]
MFSAGWIDTLFPEAVLLGTVWAEKIAMRLACSYPERVHSLIVVDIAPRAYKPRWEREFAAMLGLRLEQMNSRSEVEAALEASIKDWAFRKFLCTNLERSAEGTLKWSVNLPLLQASLPNLFQQVPDEVETFGGPTLFVRGEQSTFVTESDEPLIRRCFPMAKIRVVPGAGHNVHFDQPQAFLQALEGYWPQ